MRVAVVDDVADDRDLIVWAAEEAGYEPVVVDNISSIDDAVRQITTNADALVCDHQLGWGGVASFDGAELVARCFRAGVPSVLVTAFIMDSDDSIRVHRRHVPHLIAKDEFDSERLATALRESQMELDNSPPRERLPWRSLVRIDRVREAPAATMVDVLVPQWNPHRNVSFPIELLGPLADRPATRKDLEGRHFIAMVNIGADRAEDLYFDAFEEAGEVPTEEELV